MQKKILFMKSMSIWKVSQIELLEIKTYIHLNKNSVKRLKKQNR